jgi:tetratricopeptide (TPR) repeat protein
MANSSLDDAIDRYKQKLDVLEKARTSHPSPQMILEVLLARDEVEVLKAEQPRSVKVFLELPDLDTKLKHYLKHHCAFIISVAHQGKWHHQILQSQTNKWWWKLIYSPNPWVYLQARWMQSMSRRRSIRKRSSGYFKYFFKYFFKYLFRRGRARRLRHSLKRCCRLLKALWNRLIAPFRVTFVWICDRFDPLWKVVTVCLIIASLSLAASIAPRFFEGGPSAEGALAIIAPSVISLIVGKEMLEQLTNGQGRVEKILERVQFIPRWLRQEVALILSVLMFLGLCLVEEKRPTFASCYYDRGFQAVNQVYGIVQEPAKEPDKQFDCKSVLWLSQSQENEEQPSTMLSSAEADFERAIALNPNYAEAHFQLGWLYELRQDIELARTKYKLAIQNGSLLARVRLARLYLQDEKQASKKQSAEIAAAILMQGWDDVELLANEDQESLEKKRNRQSWRATLAWAHLNRSRYEDAQDFIDKVIEAYKELPLPPEKNSGFIWCIKAEWMQQINKVRKPPMWTQEEILSEWNKCNDKANPRDSDEDFWLTKAAQYLNSLNKSN